MKYQVTEIDSARKKMEVTVPSDVVNERMSRSFREVGKKASLKGFRPGKVPQELLEKYYGPYVKEQLGQDLVKEYINKALGEAGIVPVVPPLVEPGRLKKGEDFTFTAEVEILPKIENIDMENIEAEAPSPKATENDVNESLEKLREGQAELKTLESPRPVQDGDYVLVDFEASSEGQSLGTEREVGVEVGSGMMPEEFEQALVGMNVGDTKTVTVGYDENAQPSIAGKNVTFDIEVKDIKEREVPELDDEFAKDMGKENLEDLKKHLKETLAERKGAETRRVARREILKQLRERNPVDIPPTLVEQQKKMLLDDTKQRFESMKLNFDENQFGDEFQETAKERVHEDILLNAIADLHNIEVSDEDIDAKISEWAAEAGQDPEKLKSALNSEDRGQEVRYRVREEKTVDFLLSSVTLKYVDEEDKRAESEPESESSEAENKG